jgi:probable rRNA maturation factor
VTRSIYRPPWRIDVDVREGVQLPVPMSTLAAAITAVLDEVGAPGPASIGLILTDDTELADLNATHMGHAGPTDVLSFPLLQPSAFRAGAGSPDTPRPPGSRIHLGDIVVSVERADDQATTGRGGQTGDVRWSVGDELRLLVTHGTLHICGQDHATPTDERAMRAMEQRLLGPGQPGSSGKPSR